MKIAYFTDLFYPQISGVAASLATLSTALAEKGHDIVIFAPKPARGKKVTWDSGKVKVEYLLSLPSLVYPEVRAATPFSSRLAKMIIRFNPDIIHFQTTFFVGGAGLILGRIARKPLIGTFHGYFMEPEYLKVIGIQDQAKIVSSILWRYAVLFYNQCDAVVSPAEFSKKDLIRHGVRKPIYVIPNSIDEDMITQVNRKEVMALRQKLGLKKHVVIYVGRLSSEKSIDVLIESFAQVVRTNSDVSLLIIGGGPAAKTLAALARRLGLEKQIIFPGEVPQSELLTKGYYQLGDVFATASTSEVLPISVIEAMYFGLPLVGVKKRGMIDMVDGVGLLSKPGDAKALGENIAKLLADASLRRLMRHKSRVEYRAKYALEAVATKQITFYEDVIKSCRKKKRFLHKFSL